MNFQNDRYTLAFAESSDNEGICSVFEAEGFGGGLSVQYLRGRDPLGSFAAEGETARIMVIRDNHGGRVAAVGGAVVRREFLNGSEEKCAYLTGLKIHPDYRGKIRFIPQAYRFLYDSISDCKFFYTTILDGNPAAISMLEKRRKNMPLYRYLGHYTTYCFHGGKKILPIEKNNTDGFEELFNSHFAKQSLTPADCRCKGFGKTDFFCLRENGRIRACCFIGNQQAFKQYRMCGYGGVYKLLSKIPVRLLGYPAFPESGREINYGTASYLYIENNDPKLCSDFLRSAAAETDFSLILWGGFENNPLCAAMDKIKAVRYGSRLYSVVWEDIKETAAEGVIGVEAALL